tara:strand:+ start:536 stop:802 length:267 start_codon:yes stop_codon:yes gene_type:complete
MKTNKRTIGGLNDVTFTEFQNTKKWLRKQQATGNYHRAETWMEKQPKRSLALTPVPTNNDVMYLLLRLFEWWTTQSTLSYNKLIFIKP